jgi:hypothetical protein
VTDQPEVRDKREVLAVLRRAGVRDETIEALDASLGNVVDVQRDADVFAEHGITLERIVDWMGGSL